MKKHNDKERFIKSMLHYNNIACNSDMILKVQELVNAFTCLVEGGPRFVEICGTHIPAFIANNHKDKSTIIDNLNKLRKYRNAQPHPDKVKLKFAIDGLGDTIWQNCMEYYKRFDIEMCFNKMDYALLDSDNPMPSKNTLCKKQPMHK